MSQTYTTTRRILVLSLALLVALGLSWTASVSAKDNNTSTSLTVPVIGTVSGSTSGAKFSGTATITQFANSGGTLVALGTLTGVVTDSSNNVVQSVAANFSAPVNSSGPAALTVPGSSAASTSATATQPAVTVAAAASCSILNLTLGPIHLNLLGLTLDTNQIVVNLSAVPGAGNLLGNLLCNVTNLLNGSGNVNTIANLLNQILAAL